MIRAKFAKLLLDFHRASGTSRGVLRQKETFILRIQRGDEIGYGECNLFRGLSADDCPEYESKLQWVCDNINLELSELLGETAFFPSIQFGLEQAFLSLNSVNPFHLFSSTFVSDQTGIAINGLIWMGTEEFMLEEIKSKLEKGFDTLKMKIGAIDFEKEVELLRAIRKDFDTEAITLRVDANGGFKAENALAKLEVLKELDIHSIEQPIAKGEWSSMAELAGNSPIPIALDEELIGVFHERDKRELLESIRPQYIILKPALVGGFHGSLSWMRIADDLGIKYWITSALESNIGLNAIAQWTATLDINLPQGLGTGSLFKNNINSPLEVEKGYLYYDSKKDWDLSKLENLFYE